MDATKRKELEAILVSAFSHAESKEISSPINLAKLGEIIKFLNNDFSVNDYGYEKLRPLLEDMPDLIELVRDDSYALPRFFASFRKVIEKNLTAPKKAIDNQTKKLEAPTTSNTEIPAPLKFSDSVRASTDKLRDLANRLALKENWGDEKEVPLLRKYISYTYARLANENKVKLSADKSAFAFNTGLVDDRYLPIYALITKNKTERDLPWYLSGFCCAAENVLGKELVGTFNPLPAAADYFKKSFNCVKHNGTCEYNAMFYGTDAIYDINSGELHCDWEHIIPENVDRIPIELLSRLTKGFEVKSCEDMNTNEVIQYKKNFADYLKDDAFSSRLLLDAFMLAKELAIKKVRWNYKTAVPVYYPTENKVSLLLPLCLLSYDRVDLALVVEKTDSGNYQGHTIYPLDWAYSNARLVARPESSWLQ